jgi:hypothetical protein
MFKSVILFLFVFIAIQSSGQKYHIYINPQSRVVVRGSTNVNNFLFKYTESISINQAIQAKRENGNLILANCILNLKVRAFDSGNSMMNKDFRNMMKEDENPFIRVGLTSLRPDWNEDGSWTKGKVEIEVEMNGITKKYVVQCTLENPESLLIFGRQKMLLTDFELLPPTRMMGMVKVSELVELDLALRFATDK